MTDESMAITIGRANQEVEEWLIDTRFAPNEPNEIGADEGGFEYILGARSLYANNVNVSFTMSSEPNRKAGEIDGDQMYKQTDPLSCKIDIKYYISSNHAAAFDDPYLFMRDDIEGGNQTGKSFFPITIGRNIYNKCFLDSLDISIKSFAPVTCRATFRATAPPSGVALEGVYASQKDPNSNNQLMESNNFIFGHNCELSGWLGNLTDMNAVSEINFSRSYGRKDIYCLGEETPRESLVKNVENRMTVKTTGLNYFIPSEGIRISGDIGVVWRDNSGIRSLTTPISGEASYPLDLSMKMSSGSYVTSQGFSIRGGDSLGAELTISEAII